MSNKIKIALVTVVSCLTFFWLAVLGGGGARPFFSHPPLVALAISGATMFVIALFSKGNISSGEREDRSNRWVLIIFSLVAIASAFLPPYLDRRNIWTIDGDTIRWIGVALFTIGGFFRLYPVFVLGRRFSGLVAIQPGHTLVTDGIYSCIRHPSYLGLILNLLGWALAFRSLAGVLITVIAIWPVIGRIRAEENLLLSQFGSEYDEFRAKTRWRLVPGIY